MVLSAIPQGTLASPQYVPMPPGDFVLYKSDHFDIYYDSTRIADVSDVAIDANAAYDTVTAFLGPFDYRARIIIAANHQQYGNILYNYLSNENVSENNVGSGWGEGERGTIVIESPEQLENFETVLAHEFTHIVMRTKLIDNKYNMPEWFSEGLAIHVSGDLSAASRALVEDACRNNKLMSVSQMEDIHVRSTDPSTSVSDVTMAYAQSGMLMEYIAGKYGEESIKLIMQDFGPTGDLDKAFRGRIGYTPEDVNADWKVTLKGELSVRDGNVLSQRVQGYVHGSDGKPVANETIAFTCMRNDTSVLGRAYTAMTNSSGYYQLNLTYGPFKVHLDKEGYKPIDDSITLQKSEVRVYNVTMSPVEVATQNLLAGPALDNGLIYILLGVVNVLAVLLIAFVFMRARK
jgi:hypothetical protein